MKQLQVKNLSSYYSRDVHALKNISFQLNEGQALGIVGESGSGKSTLAKVLLGLHSIHHGEIIFDGKSSPPKGKHLRLYRKNVQMIFQDANSTLNPKLPIWKSLLEPLDNFKEFTPSFLKGTEFTKKEKAEKLLELVGLESSMVHRYPSELSGGQKQRVSIARAISLEPSFLICDEPTASLDVTVQKHILQLLKDLQTKTNMAILFISHDIRAVSFLCENILVMKNGEAVDQFSIKDLYNKERHHYTQALIQAASL
ncbi:Oligopeptide transport ATP-binding protein OppF [Bacillus sp. THAF10]|uniref:ABC transporter ATP-binding protein n=1 Tax=Bacillus sp. THAF10 TaxID=2587848 RepID=UPI0012682757|nr:dipeptide/oligopeptide/nickel ABC transporter ATP-binding protein [Bacillus sp. THAF10]QFT89574.1 Oligopeptide transport ATP-binding protein OppF [Bacillus sp. THAF10]